MAWSCVAAFGCSVLPCYSPLSAYRSRFTSKTTGKRGIVFDRASGIEPISLPCGQCIGCRLERSRQWAVRCVHESQMHEDNCFITLTYSDEHLPSGGTVVLRDFQLFMKRVRKAFGSGIRFFHCGEYGSLTRRPHYHALLFGLDFSDKVQVASRNGHPVYRSEILKNLWGLGHVELGSLTFESAAYVARYVVDKVTGEPAVRHYGGLSPEYVTMSRRPGIGSAWLAKFRSDVYPSDEVVLRGVRMLPPKFYDKIFETFSNEEFVKVKAGRVRGVPGKFDPEQSGPRLRVKEAVKKASLRSLPRSFE